jgi:mannitol-1-phosphate/altronate dehydrogenase
MLPMNGLNVLEEKRSAEGNPFYLICCTKSEQNAQKYKVHIINTVDLSDEEQMKQY